MGSTFGIFAIRPRNLWKVAGKLLLFHSYLEILLFFLLLLTIGGKAGAETYAPAGVNISPDEDWQKDLVSLRQANFSAVRLPIPWDMIEREEGKYDFSLYDPIVRQARTLGLDVLALLTGTNPLYKQGDMTLPFARFAGRVAQRYRSLIYAYELFEDIQQYTSPIGGISFSQPLALSYSRTFFLSFQAIRAFDPFARVYVGGVSPDDPVFLETLQARGVFSFADGISLLIPFSSSDYFDYNTYLHTHEQVDYIRRLLGPKKDLLLGRLRLLGHMSSSEERAAALGRLTVTLSALGVDRWFLDPLHDSGESTLDGLLPPEGLPRPVYLMFQSLNTFLAGMKPAYPPFPYQILYPGMVMEQSLSYFFQNGGLAAIVFWTTGARDAGVLTAKAPSFLPTALLDPTLTSPIQFTVQNTQEGWLISGLPPHLYPLVLMLRSQDLLALFPEESPPGLPEVIRISPLPTPSGSSTGEGRPGS